MVLVLGSVALLLAMTFSTASAAGSPPKKKHRAPATIFNCITVTNSGRTIDEVAAGFSGYVENYTCDANVTGTLYLHADIRCSGLSKVSAPSAESLPVPRGDAVAWSSSVVGSCLVCTNGVVTGTPSFYIDLYASYTGKDRYNQSVRGTSPTRTVLLSNDPAFLGTAC